MLPCRRALRRRASAGAVVLSLAGALAVLLPSRSAAPQELRLGTSTSRQPAVELILDSESRVQGVTAVFDWDPAVIAGSNLTFRNGPGTVLAEADLLVARVEPNFMVAGVVMDDDGIGAEFIPPGTHTLAIASFNCLSSAIAEESTAITFHDATYSAVDGGPILDNVVVMGGLSITRNEGLALIDGRVVCPPVGKGKLRIAEVSAPAGSCGEAGVFLDAPGDVQGFVLAVRHDPQIITLDAITTAGTVTELNGADFVSSAIFPDGGTIGVVLDLFPPFDNNVVPAGENRLIARYLYCCRERQHPDDRRSPLELVDGVFGDPIKDNVIVIAGASINPELVNGGFTCKGVGAGPRPEFHCGGVIRPADGLPEPVVGFPGDTVQLCFYYRSPPKGEPEDTGEDQIQGLSMAICYDPRFVRCKEGTFDITGTITEAVGAEFVNHNCENSSADGDPGELVVAILIDALPPFDGQTLPPTDTLLKLGCIDFEIDPAAACGVCHPVTFCDGANGRGTVPVKNLISINNFPQAPDLFNCEICVNARPTFHRGDCNFSDMGEMSVEIVDAAAIISFLFLSDEWKFQPPCLDACDANDDGRVDFADSISILRFLFQFGPPPPPPGPNTRGPDPTGDKLGCDAGSFCPGN